MKAPNRPIIRICLMVSTLVVLHTGCSEKEQEPAEPVSEAETLLREGAKKARVCTGCHGPGGISRIASIPSLAGASQDYLEEQLLAFKSGEREDPTMSSIALSLSEEDIVALSHYYASLPGPGEN